MNGWDHLCVGLFKGMRNALSTVQVPMMVDQATVKEGTEPVHIGIYCVGCCCILCMCYMNDKH